MKILHFNFCIVVALLLFSCEKKIETVTIANKVWMQQNLDVDTFADGDEIPEVKSDEDWEAYGDKGLPAWCYYDNDPTNGKVLGKLYNWHAVSSTKGLCPKGWHIPSDDEWSALSNVLGGESHAGEVLKSEIGWKLGGVPGTNQVKFTILPGGTRNKDGFFNSAGRSAYFWSSTSVGEKEARDRGFEYNSAEMVRDFSERGIGFSCRCVKD